MDVEGVLGREGQLNHRACVAAVLIEFNDQILHLFFAYFWGNPNEFRIDSEFGHLFQLLLDVNLAGRVDHFAGVLGQNHSDFRPFGKIARLLSDHLFYSAAHFLAVEPLVAELLCHLVC